MKHGPRSVTQEPPGETCTVPVGGGGQSGNGRADVDAEREANLGEEG